MNLVNKSIVLIIKTPVLGGAERQALGFADYAQNTLNCKVTIISTHSKICSNEFEEYAQELKLDNIHYRDDYFLKFSKLFSFQNFKNVIKTFLYIFSMIWFVGKFKPFMIIPFLNPPSKLAVLIYKFTGAKYTFWHQLGLDFFREDFLEKIAINKTPLFIANANNGIDEILKTYEVPRDKLYCLPQYASLKFEDQDSSKIREQLKVDSDAIVIGMISHFRKEKLFDLLFDAFQELKVDRKIHLILSGDAKNSNDTNEKYKQLLKKENKSSNKITVLTNKSVSEILNVLDIGVLVSTIEGTPNVVMEYMLYGLPVIATNHIGCKELLNSDELVINNNIEELVLKLNFLIDNPGEAKRIGLNNQKEIQKYSKENYFKKLTSIISQNQLS